MEGDDWNGAMTDQLERTLSLTLGEADGRVVVAAVDLYSRLAQGQLAPIVDLAMDGSMPVHDPAHGSRRATPDEIERLRAGARMLRSTMGYFGGVYLSMDARLHVRARRCWEIERVLVAVVRRDAPKASPVHDGLWRRLADGPPPEAEILPDGSVRLRLGEGAARALARGLEIHERVCRADMGALTEMMASGEILGFVDRTGETRKVPERQLDRMPFMASVMTDPLRVPRRSIMPLDPTASDAAHRSRAVRVALASMGVGRAPDDGQPRFPAPEAVVEPVPEVRPPDPVRSIR